MALTYLTKSIKRARVLDFRHFLKERSRLLQNNMGATSAVSAQYFKNAINSAFNDMLETVLTIPKFMAE